MGSVQNEHALTSTDESRGSERSWKRDTDIDIQEEGQKDKKKKVWARFCLPQVSHQDGRVRWMPLSMTTPILLAVIIASLLLVAAIELLAQKSQKQGGLALAPSLEQIPQYARITSQYVPQVLAVCYSLVWSWIDLDVKRMQPWFEMSKPEGALARDSLLLDYPFTFVAFVPFKAAQRRHWLVFLSGTAMVLVFWAITPLQSAQLGTDNVNSARATQIANRSRLVPVAEQAGILGPEILNTAYTIDWLDQPYPAFTTAQYPLLPFYVDDDPFLAQNTRPNWTASTSQLFTELTCRPADVKRKGTRQQPSHFFSNGKGCNTTLTIPSSEDMYSMLYIGYDDSPYGTYWLRSPTCPPTENSVHQFLAIWAYTPGTVWDEDRPEFNVTGTFCETSYFKQEVIITVDAHTLNPYADTLEAVSPKEPLSESEFNSTAFEFLLANGMPSHLQKEDHPYSFVVEQHPKLIGLNVSRPVTPMAGFALSEQNQTMDQLSDAETLHQLYSRTHKSLFSIAVNKMLVNETAFDKKTATSTFPMSGIVVNRTISAILEALILLIAIFAGILIWLCQTSPSNLTANPSSISRLIDVFRNSPQVLDSFSSVDNADEESLLKVMKDDRYKLVWDESIGRPAVIIERGTGDNEEKVLETPKGYYKPVKPSAFRYESGIAFIIAVLGVMGGISYLKWAEMEFNGLKRPSNNQEVQQILENYIPTILSTLIEPFWVLVNRLLCVLQPFKDLWKGRATPDKSISATYTSVPPQFAAWRALKSRHFILTLVCSAVFLANILTVSLPALFKEVEITAEYTERFQPNVAAAFNNESAFGLMNRVTSNIITAANYQDHTYAALANLTMGTSLPIWVAPEYFFQPWDKLGDTEKNQAGTYKVQTRGFGINSNCTSASPPSTLPVERTQPVKDPSVDNCGDLLAVAGTQMREHTYERSSGLSAIEYVATPTGGRVRQCDMTMVLGWGRAEHAEDINSTMEASFATCRPIFETALFDVNVDSDGYVLSYERSSDIETTLDYPDSEPQIEILIAHANNILSKGPRGWHNDTLSREWTNHLITVLSDSRSILDPKEPVPDPTDVLPLIDDIYRQLFALLLGFNYEYLFENPDDDQSIGGARLVKESRLFLDQPAFIISMTLLGVNVAIAVIFYTRAVVFVLPRMPTTLGSIIAYIAPSRIVIEPEGSQLDQQNRTLSFGRFIGRDGGSHVGVEFDPYVVPIDPASLGNQRARLRLVGSRKRQTLGTGSWL